ncbi:hypothetical protein ACHHYP_08702 [Achlya hypogyna]|uniref:Fanconi Anaemia group E protein C-terminal domain-containing protein n=1 Tax=Achlya hypogyna TaxID=1202772 RepID=A0A1V9YP97_ACHHY|nr:hypothetical protein ACHHYP_08702 [Achlya hypogyna]
MEPTVTDLLLAAHRGVPGLVAFFDDHVGYMELLLSFLLDVSVQAQIPVVRKRDLWSALALRPKALRHVDATTKANAVQMLRSFDADAYVQSLAQLALGGSTPLPQLKHRPACIAPIFEFHMPTQEPTAEPAPKRAKTASSVAPECIEIDVDEASPLDLLEAKMIISQQDTVVDEPPVPMEAITLSPEHQTKVAGLAKAIGRMTPQVAGAVSAVCDDILAVCLEITTGPEPIIARLDLVNDALDLAALPDDATVVLCTKLLDAQWSLRASMHLVEQCLFRKVQAAPTAVSRGLVQVLSRVAADHPSVVSERLLVPIMTSPALAEKPPQCEVVTRIVRDGLPLFHIDTLLAKLFADRLQSPLHTSERMLLVIQTLFNLKANLTQETLDLVIETMETTVARHRTSVKFATVLFTVVAKYPELCRPHRDALLELVAKCQSAMAKTALRAIEKL